MDSRLYDQKLAGHKIFKDLKGCLDDNPTGKLRNLLDLNDDVLFVWNPSENCLWCLNMKQLEENGDETPYQKLHFLSPPAFSVERVMTSPCGSRVCVWGARGVSVAELPTRWGRGGLFETTNHTILCKSCTLDERFLYSQGEVRRVHWHPSSLSHVLVLVSDNTIRLYNIAVKSGPKLVRVFTTGAKPSSLLAGRTLLESLGDTAVDFTPLPSADTLLVLRGNGDVYSIDVELNGKCALDCQVRGPLPMFPPADDNYGSESCCITAIGTRNAPPLVVVATASAALYHCLLLPNEEDDDEEGGHALYVLEAVELSSTDDVLHSYPVHLYPCSNNSYAVVHAGGVHTVTLPILSQLVEYAMADEGLSLSSVYSSAVVHAGGVHTVTLPILSQLVDYAMADEAESESMVGALCSGRSSARHLVRLAPPAAGLALTPRPLSHLLVMTTQADLLPRVLEPFDLEEQLYKEMQLRNPALEQDDINSLLKERQKLSFTSITQEILAREVSQPILSMARRDEPPPQESLELLWSALIRLRSEYICRQQRACAALADKLRALRALAHTHSDCLQNLQSDVDEVRQQSTALKEKCILAEKHQDDLKYRCSSVIRAWGSRGISPAEKQLLAELMDARHRSDALQDRLRQCRVQAHRRIEELKKWEEDYKRKDVALGKSHSDTIASILQQQTSQISTLIEETKLLKDQLSIV